MGIKSYDVPSEYGTIYLTTFCPLILWTSMPFAKQHVRRHNLICFISPATENTVPFAWLEWTLIEYSNPVRWIRMFGVIIMVRRDICFSSAWERMRCLLYILHRSCESVEPTNGNGSLHCWMQWWISFLLFAPLASDQTCEILVKLLYGQ